MTRPNTDDLQSLDDAADAARAALLEQMLFARNPLLVQAQAEQPEFVRLARTVGPAPTLFADGDLPPFTASGVAVETLMRVPWFLRHTYARLPLDEAFEFDQLYVPWTPEAAALYDSEAKGEELAEGQAANSDYVWRFRRWLAAAPAPTQKAVLEAKKAPTGAEAIAGAAAAYMRISHKTPQQSVVDVLRRVEGKPGDAAYRDLVEYARDYARGTTAEMVNACGSALSQLPTVLEESAAPALANSIATTALLVEASSARARRTADDEQYEALYGRGSAGDDVVTESYAAIYGPGA